MVAFHWGLWSDLSLDSIRFDSVAISSHALKPDCVATRPQSRSNDSYGRQRAEAWGNMGGVRTAARFRRVGNKLLSFCCTTGLRVPSTVPGLPSHRVVPSCSSLILPFPPPSFSLGLCYQNTVMKMEVKGTVIAGVFMVVMVTETKGFSKMLRLVKELYKVTTTITKLLFKIWLMPFLYFL